LNNNNVERVIIQPKGDTVTILHGNIYQFMGTKYSLDSVDSVVKLVEQRGSKERTLIFYNDEQVQVILDDLITNRPQDTATYVFKHSDDLKEWEKIFGVLLSQKQFVDFLRHRPEKEIAEIESLLANVQCLKLATEIVGDYQYDDSNNITFMFKTKDAEGSAKLPSVLNVYLQLLNESNLVQCIEVELELRKPKSESEKPAFVLTCPKLDRYLKIAKEYEINKLKHALEGYVILAGRP
jgi:hypothetical protein